MSLHACQLRKPFRHDLMEARIMQKQPVLNMLSTELFGIKVLENDLLLSLTIWLFNRARHFRTRGTIATKLPTLLMLEESHAAINDKECDSTANNYLLATWQIQTHNAVCVQHDPSPLFSNLMGKLASLEKTLTSIHLMMSASRQNKLHYSTGKRNHSYKSVHACTTDSMYVIQALLSLRA